MASSGRRFERRRSFTIRFVFNGAPGDLTAVCGGNRRAIPRRRAETACRDDNGNRGASQHHHRRRENRGRCRLRVKSFGYFTQGGLMSEPTKEELLAKIAELE